MKVFIDKLLIVLTIFGLFILCQVPIGIAAVFSQINKQNKHGFSLLQLFIVLLLLLSVLAVFFFWTRKKGYATWDLDHFRGNGKIILMGYLLLWLVSGVGSFVLLREGQNTTVNQSAITDLLQGIPPLLMWLLAGVAAPIMEETIFRAGIIRGLFGKHQMIGCLVSSFLFGLSHSPSNLGSWIIYAGLGMSLSFVYVKTKRLEASVTLHMIWNSIAFLSMFFM